MAARHALDVQRKFVFDLGWRTYFRHVWQHRGEGILHSLHEGPLPDDAYARVLPAGIREGCTGVPVVDEAVRELYAAGAMHNHARMWLASYVVHVRKVHWRAGADWLYGAGIVIEPVKESPPLTVLYDGACPLCRREIGIYRSLQPNTPVCFVDVSDAALPLPPGTTREQLLARFHVRGRDGQLLNGAQAFLALWAALPGWRWLALVGHLPGAAKVMERTYTLFLRWRPTLQRWASRLDLPVLDRQKPNDNTSRSRPVPSASKHTL